MLFLLGWSGSGKSLALSLFWEIPALISILPLILQVILQILRDPAWNGVGALVALASVGLALRKLREIHPLPPPFMQRKPLKSPRRRKHAKRKNERIKSNGSSMVPVLKKHCYLAQSVKQCGNNFSYRVVPMVYFSVITCTKNGKWQPISINVFHCLVS